MFDFIIVVCELLK